MLKRATNTLLMHMHMVHFTYHRILFYVCLPVPNCLHVPILCCFFDKLMVHFIYHFFIFPPFCVYIILLLSGLS